MSDQVQLEHPLLGPEQRIWVTTKQARVKTKSGWFEVGESDPESSAEDSQDLEEVDYDLGEPSTEEE